MALNATITKRDRTRVLTSGAEVVQTRFVVNFRHPHTGRRSQRFYKCHRGALACRDDLVASMATGTFNQLR